MASNKSIIDLANSIARDTALVDDYLTKNNIPKPSFHEDGPSLISIPPTAPDVLAAHVRALAATRELNILLQGPTLSLRTILPINDLLVLQFIYRFDVSTHVPIGGDISFADLAKATGVDEQMLARFLRYGFSNWLFTETRPGFVGHTAATRALKENQGLRDSLGLGVEEGIRGSFAVVDALERFGASEEPIECGWALANHATQPFFTELTLRHPKRSQAVAGAISALGASQPLEPILDAFDFSLNNTIKTLVDVGGGKGHLATAIAKRHPNMHCIVQDLPDAIHAAKDAHDQFDADLKKRVQFQVHDLLEEQSIAADAYLFRAIFHNWSDKYCVRMLKSLIPTLRSGNRIIVVEFVQAAPGEAPAGIDRLRRAVDLNMLAFFNARERTESDWRTLFGKVDGRLKFQGVRKVGKGMGVWMSPSVMECVWEG
ncbi:MAG: hypothetical protein Q9162_003471 [Coniocarpon cinnabarinum]